MKKLIALVALLMGMIAAPAMAANCSGYPYTLQNGQLADANQVMANFNNILNCGNTNLAKNGANSDITSLSGLTTPLTQAQGGTGSTTIIGGLGYTPVNQAGDTMTGDLFRSFSYGLTIDGEGNAAIAMGVGNTIRYNFSVNAFDFIIAGVLVARIDSAGNAFFKGNVTANGL